MFLAENAKAILNTRSTTRMRAYNPATSRVEDREVVSIDLITDEALLGVPAISGMAEAGYRADGNTGYYNAVGMALGNTDGSLVVVPHAGRSFGSHVVYLSVAKLREIAGIVEAKEVAR